MFVGPAVLAAPRFFGFNFGGKQFCLAGEFSEFYCASVLDAMEMLLWPFKLLPSVLNKEMSHPKHMEVGVFLGLISLSMPRAQCREKWMMRGGGGDEGARF